MYCIDDKQHPCSTSLTMRYIGDKWKAAILIHLHTPLRYNKLRKALPTVTERILSLQLKELEADGLISRSVLTEKPPLKVEYALTSFGQTLLPLLRAIAQWGQEAAQHEPRLHHTSCEG